jgi:hypothetical protein
MNKLLAAGCSITHGLETVSNGYDMANTEFSYAKYLAEYYQAEYCNVAYPGASNEMIFHRTVEHLTTQHYTHCVVGWTSLHREAWEKDNVVWTFNLNYGQCSDNNVVELPFIKRHPIANLSANRKELVSQVLQFWETINIKLLNDSLNQKIKHYRTTIQLLCQTKNIKLIELSVVDNDQDDLFNLKNIGTWFNTVRHPTRDEHKIFYQNLINYYETI